jgi:fluoride exporter
MVGGDRRELLAVFAGGALGALARGLLGLAMPVDRFPWPTFVANVVAALLLGYLSTRLIERLPVSGYRRPFWGTGLCGGLSTFSTLQVEAVRLLQAGHTGMAAVYVASSVVAGYVAVHVATAVARRSFGSALVRQEAR